MTEIPEGITLALKDLISGESGFRASLEDREAGLFIEPLKEWLLNPLEPPSWEGAKKFLFITSHHGMYFHLCGLLGAFEIYTKEYIKALSGDLEKIRKGGKEKLILEVFAGDGRLARYLKGQGFNIIATDNKSRKDIRHAEDVECWEAIDAVFHYKPYLTIASWIPGGSTLDLKLVETSVPLIYIGEGEGGATGSKEFWQRGDFSFKELPCSIWNMARTDTPTGTTKEKIRHHTATWLVKKSRMQDTRYKMQDKS